MRRPHSWIAVALLAAGLLLASCSSKEEPRPAPAVVTPAPAVSESAESALPGVATGTFVPVTSGPAGPVVSVAAGQSLDLAPAAAPEPGPQEKYDAAFRDGLALAADRKLPEALAALDKARAVQDTDQVREQIDRLKARIEQQAAADRTAGDIRAVLTAGKADEASRLATVALQQYGDTDAAAALTKLKQEADALVAAQADDRAGQRDRLRREADAALRDNNLRAAALALEQSLTYGGDPEARQRLGEVQAALTRYDDGRRRAAELRRDPARLEEAVAALQESAKAWDTLQVRQEIDDCTLALQKRRNTLSVAPFEVRGDVGLTAAGQTVADELLPAFKVRFDLVERGQLGRVLDELRLQPADLAANDDGRREVARLARVGYLVVGSLTPIAGAITADARLVDLRTGLVAQTARVVARSPEELLRRLPQLANVLMMTDEQKLAYEQQCARQAALPAAVAVAELPPPPELGQPAPAAVVAYTPAPPPLGGLCLDDFTRLAAPPAASAVVVVREEPVKQRLLQLSVELGDNLFRRGKYREAQAHFQLALSLSPQRQELAVRVERCRQPAPVVAVPAPVVVAAPARPRIVVLNFLVNADPGLVPPALGDWAAEQLTAYFAPNYEVIERGEVCWYMGRLGLTMRDLVADAGARRWLARAVNARFFVFGAIQQTASFDVTTHLVDAETGAQQGGARIHVQDHQELKLRLGELARQTQAAPGDADRLRREAAEQERLVNDVRQRLRQGQAGAAAAAAREGLKRYPGHAGLQTLLQQADDQVRRVALEEQRRRDAERVRAAAEAARRRQQDLDRQAAAARAAAEQKAAQQAADARAREQQRQKAADQLLAQGRAAAQQGSWSQAIRLLESAQGLRPSDATARELAQAKARAEEAQRKQAAEEQARRAAEAERKRQADLARVQAQVADARHKAEAEADARHKAQEARDQAAYTKLLEDGKRLLSQKQYAGAASAFQGARQVRKTDEVDRLLAQAQAGQTPLPQPRPTPPPARPTPPPAPDPAPADPKKRQADYQRAMQTGRQALVARRYDDATKAFTEAARLMPGDKAAAAMLKEVDKARPGRR